MEESKPIEWYLEEADTLIGAYMHMVLEASEATRFQWLMLKTIAREGTVHFRDLYPDVKRLFSRAKAKKITSALVAKGWLQVNEKRYKLTLAGRDVIENIEKNREKITAGISDQEYLAAVNTLVRMMANIHSEFQSGMMRKLNPGEVSAG